MQPEFNNITDLDYLSEAGFEKVAVTDADLKDLKKRIKNRSISLNSNIMFGFVSLIVGVFLGISVFFTFYNAPKIYQAPPDKTVSQANEPVQVKPAQLTLDTIKVIAENFVKPTHKTTATKQDNSNASDESVVLLPHIETPSLGIQPDNLNETQLKYIPNAPIIFIHDLKITNYTTLYFKQNKFVSLTVRGGLDASYANKGDKEKENILKPEPAYYLHQAISDAMLYFNKRNFNQCQVMLNQILEINPNDINCRFYSGMCNYYKKDYVNAVKNFDACINSSNNTFLNEAQYYKALSLYESNNKAEAFDLLKQIISEGGFYAAKAKLYLN